MEDLYKQFEEDNYKIYHFNIDIPIPEKPMDIKDLIFYYIMFLRHKQMGSDYFKEEAHFVCIPNNEIILKDMNECIDFIVYIKYKMKSKEIILNKNELILIN